MKIKSIISIIVLFITGLYAYSQEKRPEWTYGYSNEMANSYIEVVVGYGYDLADARKKAMQEIILRRSLATGTEASVSMTDNAIQISSGNNLIMNALVKDEYHERIAAGEYKVYLLVQTAKNPALKFDKVTVSDRYPFSARVFVPGMAQIYKGSTGKGIGFIAGETAFIAGIVVSECMRTDYIRKISMTHDVALKTQYRENYNACVIARNVSIAGAVAVYVWNVIDGAVAKGRKDVFLGEGKINFVPYVDLHSSGLALNINF